MSPRSRVALAAVCLCAGASATLLASDAVRWQNRMRSDDARFAAVPERRELWTLRELFPFGAARAVLDLDDDLAYRRAAQTFVLGQPRQETYTDTELIAQRARAQVLLADIVGSDQDPKARAAGANLLGVLGFASAVLDPPQASTYLSTASASFRQAISLDPQHVDAKYNLELALARLRAAQRAAGPGSQATQGGIGSGSGARRPGSGY